MQEPADHLEYGTVIKNGGLFRHYTRDGRGTKFGGDTPEVTRDGIHWNKLTGGQVVVLSTIRWVKFSEADGVRTRNLRIDRASLTTDKTAFHRRKTCRKTKFSICRQFLTILTFVQVRAAFTGQLFQNPVITGAILRSNSLDRVAVEASMILPKIGEGGLWI